MRNRCDAAKMSCEVAALSFQVNANYRTWSIDFTFDIGAKTVDFIELRKQQSLNLLTFYCLDIKTKEVLH